MRRELYDLFALRLKLGWLEWVIDRARPPSRETPERGISGEDPGRLMRVGERVSAVYSGMFAFRCIECRALEEGLALCCVEALLESRRELLDREEPVDTRELAPLRWGARGTLGMLEDVS